MVQERKSREKSASRNGPDVLAKAEQLLPGTTEIIANEKRLEMQLERFQAEMFITKC